MHLKGRVFFQLSYSQKYNFIVESICNFLLLSLKLLTYE
jgi:hypothetical protein